MSYECGKSIAWLLSDEDSFSTGCMHAIDGGWPSYLLGRSRLDSIRAVCNLLVDGANTCYIRWSASHTRRRQGEKYPKERRDAVRYATQAIPKWQQLQKKETS